MKVEIQRALPSNLMAIFVEKGCHLIEQLIVKYFVGWILPDL
jgi:hypothetical protein